MEIDKNKGCGCLGMIIAVCVIVGYWHHWIWIVAAILLLISAYNKAVKRKQAEAKRKQMLLEAEEKRKRCVVELLDAIYRKNVDLFQLLLRKNYPNLQNDDVVKVQKAFVMMLESEGLRPQASGDTIAAGRHCYYKTEVQIVQQRQRQGERYIDYDNAVSATMYIFEKTIELVSTGHRTIKIQDVLKIMIGTDDNTACLLNLTLRNCGAPALIICPDTFIVRYVIEQMQVRIQ